MKRTAFYLFFVLGLAGCGGKNGKANTPEEPYFPAIPFFKSEVRNVDTSVFRIIRVETVNGRSDTQFVRREDFGNLAGVFTGLPDITEHPEDYTETKMYDEGSNEASFVYESKEAEAPVRKQIIYARPTPGGEADIRRIYVERWEETPEGIVEKKMTWEAGRKFTVVSILPKEGGSEQIRKQEVIWNDFPAANRAE